MERSTRRLRLHGRLAGRYWLCPQARSITSPLTLGWSGSVMRSRPSATLRCASTRVPRLGEFFINTSRLGSYPAYVAARERRERRWGKGTASTLAVLEIWRTEKPLRAVLDGRECLVATMFVGNCRYQPSGFVPIGGSG